MASPFLTAALRRPSALRTATTATSQWARYSSFAPKPQRSNTRTYALVAALMATGAGAAVWSYPRLFPTPESVEPEKAEIVFEKPRKKAASKEENRDLVSSQHLQVKNSWEHPGVYAWGSNAGKVVAPDSKESVIKTPRRIPYFDGQILRDLKLDRDFGAAVTEKGDLVQWGTAFSKDASTPVVTLKGKDISKIAISRDRIIALSSNGSVYSIPVAKADQVLGQKQSTSSSVPLWTPESPAISYRTLKPADLGWGEKIVDVKSGLQHCLLLTSKGRVFSAASSSEEFPSRGQLGIRGLTWQTRPAGPYDQPHEVTALHSIKDIATGDFHSLALDNQGRVFSFGDNTAGQLGLEQDLSANFIDTPTPLPISKLYSHTNLLPKATSIAAGGQNSFFTIDATDSPLARTIADTWVCGSGIHGSLGTGKWTHMSPTPTKIKALSNLSEYDEATNRLIPIRLAHLAVGSTHACAVLDNLTHLTASSNTSNSDTNFGADALWWGGNEYYQLGTGKRNNVNVPVYIGPLDGGKGIRRWGGVRGGAEDAGYAEDDGETGEDGKGRKVSFEQRVECGRYVTGVYSGA
ncbi:hypothetical protein N0V88_005663 [Collariella sp. IMI 366227]|nr:hypothetical protein N0V88_005663 [Collariella sp. IMI 366227]